MDEEQDLGPPELHVGFTRVQQQQILPHLGTSSGWMSQIRIGSGERAIKKKQPG